MVKLENMLTLLIKVGKRQHVSINYDAINNDMRFRRLQSSCYIRNPNVRPRHL